MRFNPYFHHHRLLNLQTKNRCSHRWQTSPPILQPSEMNETYSSSLILVYPLHYVKTRRHPQNRKYIMHCVADWATATDNIKIGEIWTYGFWGMWAYRQTDKHTDIQIRYADGTTSHPYVGRSSMLYTSDQLPLTHNKQYVA